MHAAQSCVGIGIFLKKWVEGRMLVLKKVDVIMD